MFFSVFIHSIRLFQTITQSFYIALSQNSIHRRINYPQPYYLSAAVLIIRSGINYTRRRKGAVGVRQRVAQKKISRKKSLSAENCRTVPKKSHSISLYIETNYRMLSPILIH